MSPEYFETQDPISSLIQYDPFFPLDVNKDNIISSPHISKMKMGPNGIAKQGKCSWATDSTYFLVLTLTQAR